MLGGMRDVVVMLDGEICAADPIAPGSDPTWVHRVPGVGTIIVTRPVRTLFRTVPNVSLDGAFVPGTAFAPDLLNRASAACAAVLTVEMGFWGWTLLTAGGLPQPPARTIVLHAALGAGTTWLARLGQLWATQLAIVGSLAGIVTLSALLPKWAPAAAPFTFTLACAHGALAVGLLDLTATRRHA